MERGEGRPAAVGPCEPVYLNPFYEDRFIAFLDSLRDFSDFGREVALGCLKYHASAGSPINYSAKRVKDRSNAKIGKETEIFPGEIVVIQENTISIRYFGTEYPVVQAPAKFTKAKKTAFLKAVVRTFMDDPENIRRYIPAAALNQGASQAAPARGAGQVPEDLVERITGSPFPGPGAGADVPVSDESAYLNDIEEVIQLREEDEPAGYDELDQENNPESPEEIIQAFSTPAKKPEGWIPHLRLSITEEMIRA